MLDVPRLHVTVLPVEREDNAALHRMQRMLARQLWW